MVKTETAEFLETVWGGKPDEHYILIWTLADKRSAWFRDIDNAARYCAECSGDTYMGVGLSATERGASVRCPANEIAGIAGLWADIDYQDGEAHQGENIPPNIEAAQQVIDANEADESDEDETQEPDLAQSLLDESVRIFVDLISMEGA